MDIPDITITTESGSRYQIARGICKKYDVVGNAIDAFKVFALKDVPDSIKEMSEIHALPNSLPTVGNRMYVGGINGWWLSTAIKSIEIESA